MNDIELFKELPYDIKEYIYKIAVKPHYDLLKELKTKRWIIVFNVLNNIGYKGLIYWSQFRTDELPLKPTHILLNFTIINNIIRLPYLSKNELLYELEQNDILVSNRLTKQQLISRLLLLSAE